MMKWYRITYINRYNLERSHHFSGNMSTVELVVDTYRIDLASVSSFTINDEPVDIVHYLGGDNNGR